MTNKNTIPKSYYTNVRDEMLEYIPLSTKRVLEIGCSEGNFGRLIKEKNNVEVWGVELCEDPAKKAVSKIDKVFIGNYENTDFDIPEKYFDCVVFNDVLEHFCYPENILKKIKPLLSAKGVVVASIPNVRYIGNLTELLLKKDWKYKDAGILDNTHFRFFTEKSIIRLFENCGYEVTTIKGINKVKTFNTNLLVYLTFGFYNDVKYLNFAVVAKTIDN